MRHSRLRQADGPLDIARIESPFVARDQTAARLSGGSEKIQDLQAGRIAKGQSFRRTLLLEEYDKTGRFGVPLDGESIDVEGRRCEVSLRVLDVDRRPPQLRLRLEVKSPEGS